MNLKNRIFTSAVSLLVFVAVGSAHAVSIDWGGTYRFEWTQVERPSLASPYGMKAFGLNYLSLSPKIIAADGVNIVSRFDVLANQDAFYRDGQFGQLFGQGWSTAAAGQSNVYSQQQRSTGLTVSQLYLNINQEYGALVVGRAPIEFGLGMTHNAGTGAFDHWADTEDLVGYKFIVDNFFFMPIIGRVYDNISQGNQVQDVIFHLQYESKDTGSLLGVMHKTRKASSGANDAPLASAGNTNGVGEYNVQTVNFIFGREWESLKFKMEAGFNSGSIGQRTTTSEDVKANGYGIVTETHFSRKDSKLGWSMKLGMATGDDPSSAGTYEGFQFDRNYDVAMLLFNHRLGQKDFLTTNAIKDTTKDFSNSLDDEAVSNVVFVAPKMSYAWSDRLDLNNTLIYGQLLTNPVAGNSNFNKDLGLEWDLDLVYKPMDRIQWVNQLGVLFPGKAFKNGDGVGGNLETATNIGFASKVAVSF
ncbi:MAG: hypothetical protein IPM97_09830 [Bdellovibrionaceae bacterium]|nr:hypothetical protein [Pseudobdellovibrionaceae bacterium]